VGGSIELPGCWKALLNLRSTIPWNKFFQVN